MHSLFWKIFITFWVSLVLFASLSVLSASVYIEHTRTQDDTESPRQRILSYLKEARQVADEEGLDGLTRWLRKIDSTEAIPFLLIDNAGSELLGRPVPLYITERIERRNSRPPHAERMRRSSHRGQITLPDGRVYQLVPDFRGVTLSRMLQRPRVIAIPIFIAALISGLVCFLLARYLTTPIQRLSRATHDYAAGNLDLRVEPAMGRRQDEIADLARDFDRMAERLQAVLGAQKQLLSDVSHELRSPLARLQVALGLARQHESEQDNPELDRIELEAERLNELIGQLLSLSRLDAGMPLSHTEMVDVAMLLNEIAKDAAFEAQSNNKRVAITNTIPAVTLANEPLLRSALENVVRNAILYTDENTTVAISMQVDREDTASLLIKVCDHGPGVPDEMLDRLFEPFVRVGSARDRNSGGYGLGLAIAKRAIQLHGGAIAARNAAGGGLQVSIRLPSGKAV